MLSIRTQDRMALVPYTQIRIYEVNNNEYRLVALYNENNKLEYNIILGTYATKERALEVLDEIEIALLSTQRVLLQELTKEIKHMSYTMIYQMPKE